jgi:hypothetical protein
VRDGVNRVDLTKAGYAVDIRRERKKYHVLLEIVRSIRKSHEG